MALEQVTNCPICGSNVFEFFLTCQDHTTTGEPFQLQKCKACSFVITNPRPDRLSIGKYYSSNTYVSHNARPGSLLDSIYFLVRRFTLRWKSNLLLKFSNKGSLLDYGCGTGEFLNSCKNEGWDCSGIEPSPIARTIARETTGLSIQENVDDIENKKFDVITLWHVLEHVHDLNSLIDQLKQSLATNGMLFIAVPNHEAADAKVYQEYWAGYDVPRHLWHFSKETMTLLLLNHGFRIKAILPMKLDSTYVSLLSEKYRSQGKQTLKGLLRALFNGLNSNIKAASKNNYSSLIYVCTPEK